MTSQKQNSLFTEEQLTFSQEASLANPTQVQESDLAKKMRDTSGRKCLEQYEKFSRNGSWAKTYSALLIGTGEWYSKRCKLSWKLKGTKYKRTYFQLVAKTHHTKESVLGLLPTPTLQEFTNSTFPPSQKKRLHIVGYFLRKGISPHSLLNPQYLEEMMGFPKDWTLKPFLNGETNL